MLLKLTSFARLALVAFLVSSCAIQQPGPRDWCYIYTFEEAGINVMSGTLVPGGGILSDATGLLQVNWVAGQTVQPIAITVRATRGSVAGDISVTMNALIFGMTTPFSGTIPGSLTSIEQTITPQNAGESGSTANITIDASAQFTLDEIEISGRGANPFARNDCGPNTETQTPTTGASPTPLPSATIDPSITPTLTPTMTATPPPDLPCLIVTGWIPASRTYTWLNGAQSLSWQRPQSMPAGSVFYGGYVEELSFSGASNVTSFASMGGTVSIATRNVVSIISSAYLVDVTAKADAIAGLYPTHTRLDAGAAAFGVGSQLDLNFSANGGAGVWSVTTTHRVRLILASDSQSICAWAEEQEATPTPTSTTPPTPTTIPTRTPMGIFNSTPRPTRTPISVSGTSTPRPPPTAVPTGTPLPTLGPTNTLIPAPTLPATGTPSPTNPNPDGENEAEWSILGAMGDFFAWIQNAINGAFDWLGQLGRWLQGMAYNIGVLFGNFMSLIGGIIGNAVRFFLELWDIAALLVQLLFGLVGLLWSWLSFGMARITAIFSAFGSTPAVPIPGLPQCASNPTAHDVCAFYYILDYTLLAQGTPGAFIVPLVTIIMNLSIILLFVKFVLKFLRRGENITNA
jgi:hypothetical protein